MAGKAKKAPKTDAQKAADFKKLAEKHCNTAVSALQRLSRLGNPAKYASTPAQRSTIKAALENAASAALNALESGGVSGGVKL